MQLRLLQGTTQLEDRIMDWIIRTAGQAAAHTAAGYMLCASCTQSLLVVWSDFSHKLKVMLWHSGLVPQEGPATPVNSTADRRPHPRSSSAHSPGIHAAELVKIQQFNYPNCRQS